MTKHTPGPWRVDGGCIEAPDDKMIGSVLTGCTKGIHRVGSKSEQVANARLIAAAPEAHEILESIHEFFRDGGPVNPSAMFDETRTYKQAVAEYLKKAIGGAR